jgi:hypothetical protein
MADWKEVWSDAIKAATGKLQPRGAEAERYMRDAAAAHKKSLESLLAAFTDGKIDQATVDSELADEKRILRAELLAVEAIGKKAAQDAANAFFIVLETALAGGIKGLL